MSEKKGFKNCPSITEFKVGMRFREHDNGDWWTVGFVDRGTAVCLPHHNEKDLTYRNISASFPQQNIPGYTLDLDSIWKHRQYERDDGCIEIAKHLEVVCLSEKYIGFLWGTDGSGLEIWPRERFLRVCKPIEPMGACMGLAESQPVADPAPSTVEAPQAWKPEAGERCLSQCDRTECWYIGRSPTNGSVAVIQLVGQDVFLRCSMDNLHPLPPDPPVKVGEIIEMTNGDWWKLAKVTGVSADGFDFCTEFGCPESTKFRDVTITHYVPAAPKE